MERAINEVVDQLLASKDKSALVKVLTEIVELIEKNVYNKARMELMDELRDAVLEEVAMNGGGYEGDSTTESKTADRKHTALFGQRGGFEAHTSFTGALSEDYDDDGNGNDDNDNNEIIDDVGNSRWALNLQDDNKPLASHLGQVNASTATLDIDDESTIMGDSDDEREAMFDAAFNARFAETPKRPVKNNNDDEIMAKLMQNPLFARVNKNLDNLKAGKPMYSPAELVAIRGKDFGELDPSVSEKFSKLQMDNLGNDDDAYIGDARLESYIDMKIPHDDIEELD